MGTLHTDKAWISSGRRNLYFQVLTDDQYLDKNLSEEGRNTFFESGEYFVNFIFNTIHKHLNPSFKPQNVLDFGCGVGRLTMALAKRAQHVTGLDISKEMLKEGRKNAEKFGIHNISFLSSDDELSQIGDQKFDLINSIIVLQHINVDRGMNIIRKMIQSLDKKGICALHLTYKSRKSLFQTILDYVRYRIPYLNNFLNLLRGKRFYSPLMQMNNYDLNDVFLLLQKEGIRQSHVVYTDHGSYLGTILFFQKQ